MSGETMEQANERMSKELELLRKQLVAAMREKRDHLRDSNDLESDKERGGDHTPNGSDEDVTSNHGERRQGWKNSDFKVDIPTFEGKLDSDEFLEWVETVERIFEYKDVVEEKKVKLVARRLRKYASTWWTNVVSKKNRQGKGPIRSWKRMKRLMKEKFLPSYYLQENYSKLQHLRQ